jgi:DNA polymerase
VRLYPIFHPAAALYTNSMLETLRGDFARLPDLLAQPAPPQPEAVPEIPEPEVALEPEAAPAPAESNGAEPQMGLF